FLDIVVANNGASSVTVLFNFGNAQFDARSDYAVGDAPVSVALLDLDRDGDLDIVVGNSDGTISVKTNARPAPTAPLPPPVVAAPALGVPHAVLDAVLATPDLLEELFDPASFLDGESTGPRRHR